MNRPRNRQPRQGGNSKRQTPRNQPRATYTAVPGSQQVIPGASVSIVLKQDQATGREVQGIVQDLLSRRDHPRGIKVRLRDGRIGRVQRMVSGEPLSSTDTPSVESASSAAHQTYRKGRRRGDMDQAPSEPPPRTLGDFIPDFDQGNDAPESSSRDTSFSSATVKCPICGTFEGDEAAVSHHIEEHLD